MKNKLFHFMILAVALLSSEAIATESMDLNACFQAALKQSETVQISDAEITAARARYSQVVGTLLPHLAANASELLQDTSGNTNDNSVGGTFTRFSRPETAITLDQSLFQGLRAINGLKIGNANIAQKKFLKDEAERLLFRDVALAFYTIAQIERDLSTTVEIIHEEEARLTEMNKRVDLGKSRESELLAQETAIALLEAELETKKGQKQIAYELMSFLTGLDPQPPIRLQSNETGPLKTIDDYVAHIAARPDLKAVQEEEKIADANVGLKKGDLYPNIDLEANYYPYRVGFQKDIKWDALFSFNLPLFNWETYGSIREAKTQAKQASLKTEETVRSAISEVKKSYEAWQSAQNQFRKFVIATSKAKASYEAQLGDFRLGLVDNLDLLQSRRIWFDALRNRDASEIQARIDWTVLQINAGVLP